MRPIATVTVCALLPLASAADEGRAAVYQCLDRIGNQTTWGECLNLTFAPCSGYEVGSDGHLTCLVQQGEDWQQEMLTAQTKVMQRLNQTGTAELGGLLLAWPTFVEDKCETVATARAHISATAARLGCQVSEMVLMANEFRACLAGRSVESYCARGD